MLTLSARAKPGFAVYVTALVYSVFFHYPVHLVHSVHVVHPVHSIVITYAFSHQKHFH